MSLLSLGPPKEKRSQLYFRDDGKFIFRRLEIEDTFLVIKNKDGEVIQGWCHFNQNQFPFPGYKNIPRDIVTLSHSRDILFDPYGLVPVDDLPDAAVTAPRVKGNNGKAEAVTRPEKIRAWLANIGKSSRLKILAKRGKSKNYDKLIYFLGTALLLEIVVILILAAT